MKVCQICGRHPHRGRRISRRGLAKKKGGVGKKTTGISHRTFKPNLQRIRALVEGKVKRLRVCAACIRAGKIVKPPVKYRPPKPKPVEVTAPVEVEAEVEGGEGGDAPAPEAQEEGKAGESAE